MADCHTQLRPALRRGTARRRGGSGVNFESTPIARRKVEVYSPEGGISYHATHAEAYSLVENDKAEWCGIPLGHDSAYKAIRLWPAQFCAGGTLDIWKPRASGNYLGRGAKDVALPASCRGELVMQLV